MKVFSAMKVALFYFILFFTWLYHHGNICQTGNLVQTSKVQSFGLK